jgi:transketolase
LVPVQTRPSIAALRNVATRLRIDSVRATSEAGSGHPTSCASAAEIVAALFFAEMRYDPRNPHNADNDRFVLSKGHAAPVLYAAWAEVGLLKRDDLLALRRLDSDLEGHPTPRLSFVDVATGSLGQGICAAVGIALNARRIKSDYRTYALLGDGESAEGSVWEAAEAAAHDRLDSLCGITDVNGLGQSGPSIWNHDMEAYASKWRAFGWHSLVVDGHDVGALLDAFDQARETKGQPTMILARTIKGKGMPLAEGKSGWHGKAFKTGEELESVLKALESQLVPEDEPAQPPDGPRSRRDQSRPAAPPKNATVGTPAYRLGEGVATREAYGTALAKLGDGDDRIVALDGDVKNSTFSEKFEAKHPDRFFQNFIAEQVMIGSAMGLAARGAIPFPSTFAAFLTRAYDFIRMACISNVNIKVAGSHAGVSIGEDGPSQMALEDLSLFRAINGSTVLYPADGPSTIALVTTMCDLSGISYLRTTRESTAILYRDDDEFPVGGSRTLASTDHDEVTLVGAGITVHTCLAAHDILGSEGISSRVIDCYSVKPIDSATLRTALDETELLVVVEDHRVEGGLGDAVLDALAASGPLHGRVRKLGVTDMPGSATPEELRAWAGIDADGIAKAAREAMAL